MLTLKSKFSEFISLCSKAGACADKGEAIPVMEDANKGNGMTADGTCEDGFKLYLSDTKFPEGWAYWVLDKVGKEMDEACRGYFISKIKDPIGSLHILAKVDFTVSEQKILKANYEGKLPTAEKELRDGVVSIKTAVAP